MLGGLARDCRHPKGQTRRTVEMACLRVRPCQRQQRGGSQAAGVTRPRDRDATRLCDAASCPSSCRGSSDVGMGPRTHVGLLARVPIALTRCDPLLASRPRRGCGPSRRCHPSTDDHRLPDEHHRPLAARRLHRARGARPRCPARVGRRLRTCPQTRREGTVPRTAHGTAEGVIWIVPGARRNTEPILSPATHRHRLQCTYRLPAGTPTLVHASLRLRLDGRHDVPRSYGPVGRHREPCRPAGVDDEQTLRRRRPPVTRSGFVRTPRSTARVSTRSRGTASSPVHMPVPLVEGRTPLRARQKTDANGIDAMAKDNELSTVST